MFTATLQGFLLGAGLIIAIGSQNAYVLRQGIRREHVFTISLVCFLSDAFLIILGVAGLGQIVSSSPGLLMVARVGGALFLFGYAIRAFREAMRSRSLETDLSGGAVSLKSALLTVLALTFLNPHVYLDTVVLIGSLSAQYPPVDRGWFALGACVASFIWFFALGFGARLLTPLFSKPFAWQILDLIIGGIMLILALMLIAPLIL